MVRPSDREAAVEFTRKEKLQYEDKFVERSARHAGHGRLGERRDRGLLRCSEELWLRAVPTGALLPSRDLPPHLPERLHLSTFVLQAQRLL